MAFKPVARVGDLHECPIKGHGTTKIEDGQGLWVTNGLPTATVGCRTGCGAVITGGSPSSVINGKPIAHVDSPTDHGGVIVTGSPDAKVEVSGGNFNALSSGNFSALSDNNGSGASAASTGTLSGGLGGTGNAPGSRTEVVSIRQTSDKTNIEIQYTQKAIQIAVLSLDEASEFAQNLWKEHNGKDVLDDAKKIWDGGEASRDAYKLAKGLGGLGVAAYAKVINGQQYIILKDYRQHLKTLAKGNIWKASNPQVIQLGLGKANMARKLLKVGLVIDIAFSAAINATDTIIHDEKTLLDFAGNTAVDLVKGVVATGIGVAAGVVFGSTILTTGVIFAVVTLLLGFGLDDLDKEFQVSDNLVRLLKQEFDD